MEMTKPERSVDWSHAKELLRQYRRRMCEVCTNQARWFGDLKCKVPGRVYEDCKDDGLQPQFEPNEKLIGQGNP